jgi:peptidyl-prolyl cis-trans isomerase C
MKKLLLTTAFIAIATTAQAEILAKVNGRPVTRQEVERSLAEVATMENGEEPKLGSFPLDFQRAFVDKYIEKLLIVDEARRAGVNKDAEVVSEVKSFEDNLIQQKYLTDLVISQRTDKKLRDIYTSKFKTKEGKQEIHASHILVKTEDEAKKIRKELDAGADFDALADKYSIDPGAKISSGDLGYFTADEKVADFSKAAFALKKGETSSPVKTEFGWHIIKVYDKRKFNSPSYAEAISDVEGALATEVIDSEVQKLKSSAKVEYLGQFAGKPAIVKKAPLKSNNIAAESIPPQGHKTTIPTPKPVAAAPAKPATKAASKPVVAEAKPAKVDVKPVIEAKPVEAKPIAPKTVAAPIAKPAPKQTAKPATNSGSLTAAADTKPVSNSNLKSGGAISSPVRPAVVKIENAND